MYTSKSQHGITLVELILFIIIISVALTGLLLVMNVNTRSSVDPLLRKQSLAIAESMLEEIQLQDFTNPVGGFTGTAIQGNRSRFDDIFDYNGFITTGIYPADGSATGVPGLANYNLGVAVVNPSSAWGTIPASNVAQITVTVTDPGGYALEATGYRVNY